MTRIALISSSYPPSLGGVEELTRHLALTLVEAGDQVEVWTGHPDDSTPETAEIRDGIVVRRLPMPLPATNWSALQRSATTGRRTLFSLRSAAAAFRPDVLHVQCFGPNGTYATALSRMTGIPLVISLQGETLMDDADIFETSRVLRGSLRMGLRTASAVTGCSAFTLADAEKRFGLSAGEGRVIPNGVEVRSGGNVSPSTEASPLARPGRPYIFALGRVVEKKGFDLLLSAYVAMGSGRDAADLVIAGTGAAMGALQRQAAESGVADSIHVVGRLNREEVAGAMAGALLFVMPSRVEPFGIVILEAWRAGTAVVASNRGGAPEFVRNDLDGVLVDPFDTAAFAAQLESLVLDDERRARIARSGQVRVEEFSWQTVAERYREIYSAVTASGGARTRSSDDVQGSHQGEWVG
jgi:glycosyltransferase involved in cell wall biosynthesis